MGEGRKAETDRAPRCRWAVPPRGSRGRRYPHSARAVHRRESGSRSGTSSRGAPSPAGARMRVRGLRRGRSDRGSGLRPSVRGRPRTWRVRFAWRWGNQSRRDVPWRAAQRCPWTELVRGRRGTKPSSRSFKLGRCFVRNLGRSSVPMVRETWPIEAIWRSIGDIRASAASETLVSTSGMSKATFVALFIRFS